jgi:osmotically-inducible protein OsmY
MALEALMRRTIQRSFIVALLALFAATACNTNDATRDPAVADPKEPISEVKNDATIRTEVQAKFYADDLTRGRDFDVVADNGVVTVRGEVEDEAAKRRAIELANDAEGVTQVRDEIRVRPVGVPRDAERPASDDLTFPSTVTAKILASYFLDPDVKTRNIDVTTSSGGVVTLEGVVDTPEAEAEAVRIARETEGVKQVDSRLRVQPQTSDQRAAESSSHADAWLTTKIQAKYFLDGEVRGRDVNVDTRDGIVTLTGTLHSEAERRQAVALARSTDGVRDVTDALKVDPRAGEEPKAQPRSAAAKIDRPDAWITMKIQAHYFLDPDVKGHEIDVDTRDGVVTLTGSVDAIEAKNEAELIAKGTDGVTRVVNRLMVETN